VGVIECTTKAFVKRSVGTRGVRVESLGTCPTTDRKDFQHGWPASRREQTRAISGRLLIINVRNRKDSPTKNPTQ
jgi:hypothetical protein